MKKKLLIGSSILLGLTLVFTFLSKNENDKSNKLINDNIVKIHKKNLENSPFKETLKLTKKERKTAGIPPDRYYEDEFELTMNPIIGRPTPENIGNIRESIKRNFSARIPGDGVENDWESRGPDNVGGRTRGLMFDPNDSSNETVFAGGVSGGLWKNTNISNENSTWTRVDLPENLNVSVITADPINSNIFYIGTGESYTNGDVSGDGVWQSTDGGITWARVLGGVTGPTVFESASNISVNTPISIAADYNSRETTNFGTLASTVISASFILANDAASENPTEGCGTFGEDATGRIAIIRRGNCTFVEKVKNAQDAGALGVIIVNNVPGVPINMAGTDATIIIPAVMISQSDGNAIIDVLENGTDVNGSINPATGNFTGALVPGIQQINDIKIKNNNGISEVYVAAGDTFYGSANVATFLGGTELGIFKSVDQGVTWNEVNIPQTAGGNDYEPNDIEIGVDGKIWFSTIDSDIFGDGGGEIFSSSDGENFQREHTIGNADRTQIAVSSQNADVIYVLAEVPGGIAMQGTTDGFDTDIFALERPNDVDQGINANDFTRGQAFYDLLLEVDPNDDQILFAGGIDLFRSVNGARQGNLNSWTQISKWSNNNQLANLNVPLVHADQHAMAFSPEDSSITIFGNDGGVYYSRFDGGIINQRNNGFVTSQFYTVGVAPTTAFSGNTDYFIGGLQDNGSQFFEDVGEGINSSIEATDGDGAHSFFDQDGSDQYFITNFVFNRVITLIDIVNNNAVIINNENESNGSFINPQALDSNLDILYSNYSSGNNSIIRRYSGIKSSSTLQKVNLTDAILTSRPTAFEVSPFTTTSSTLLVGTFFGDVLRVDNADTSADFTDIDPDNNIVGSISDVQFGVSENDIFVTVHNYGVENIWYTSDGGTTWFSKEGDLPDLPVKAILQNPLNTKEVIIGTELGIWATSNFSDASPNWVSSQAGMSNVRITDMDLRDDNAIYVSTYGRGVFSGKFLEDPTADNDDDGVFNTEDNCPNTANADQADADGNGIGDVCQDIDGDGILDINDNCLNNANPDQADADGDGIGDVCEDRDGDTIPDIEDNCPDTANTNQADGNGDGIGDVCDTSFENANNISLQITSERCEGQNNGIIRIDVEQTFVNYTVTVKGNGVNLSQSITVNSTIFNDIAIGAYTVCVSVDGRDFEQCFEINIDSAPILDAVFNSVNTDNETDSQETVVNVDSGTAPYTVMFNSEVVMVTSQTSFKVNTSAGGLLEITSAVACEGKLSKTIDVTKALELSFGPNPVLNNLTINMPNVLEEDVEVQVYDLQGKVVFNKSMRVQNQSQIIVPFANITNGVYFVRLNLETPEVIRIIKK